MIHGFVVFLKDSIDFGQHFWQKVLSVFLLTAFLDNIHLHNLQYCVNIARRIAKMLAKIFELLNLDNNAVLLKKENIIFR